MSSIFTRIIKGELRCYKIAENDKFLAFLAHAHIHLVPMQSANDVNFTQPKLSFSKKEMEEVLNKIIG